MPTTLEDWKTASEIAKNGFTVLAFVAAWWAWKKWRVERHDRATDVLLKLDALFNAEHMLKGRSLIEEDASYRGIAGELHQAVERNRSASSDRQRGPSSRTVREGLVAVDTVLGFYVLLCGVRAAGQVPDASLRSCFRYWLSFYDHPDRKELREYIDAFYPTLKRWVDDDRNRPVHKRFFTPEEFPWARRTGPASSGQPSADVSSY